MMEFAKRDHRYKMMKESNFSFLMRPKTIANNRKDKLNSSLGAEVASWKVTDNQPNG